MPKYPHDRHNGYVVLECNDVPWIPFLKFEAEKTKSFAEYKHYWNIWKTLSKRLYGKDYEPSALKNHEMHDWGWR
jgi:hypothetical protein